MAFMQFHTEQAEGNITLSISEDMRTKGLFSYGAQDNETRQSATVCQGWVTLDNGYGVYEYEEAEARAMNHPLVTAVLKFKDEQASK